VASGGRSGELCGGWGSGGGGSFLHLCIGIGCAVVRVFGVLFLVHSWYPSWCCGGVDCHPVLCAELVIDKGTVVFPSPDGRCHVCEHLGVNGYRHLYCVFVPQGVS